MTLHKKLISIRKKKLKTHVNLGGKKKEKLLFCDNYKSVKTSELKNSKSELKKKGIINNTL